MLADPFLSQLNLLGVFSRPSNIVGSQYSLNILSLHTCHIRCTSMRRSLSLSLLSLALVTNVPSAAACAHVDSCPCRRVQHGRVLSCERDCRADCTGMFGMSCILYVFCLYSMCSCNECSTCGGCEGVVGLCVVCYRSTC